jgi:hypothetical protein
VWHIKPLQTFVLLWIISLSAVVDRSTRSPGKPTWANISWSPPPWPPSSSILDDAPAIRRDEKRPVNTLMRRPLSNSTVASNYIALRRPQANWSAVCVLHLSWDGGPSQSTTPPSDSGRTPQTLGQGCAPSVGPRRRAEALPFQREALAARSQCIGGVAVIEGGSQYSAPLSGG